MQLDNRSGKRVKTLLISAFFLFGTAIALVAQPLLTPRSFTNRPLGLPGDASSVGWNPSVLGLGEDIDAVGGVSYDTSFSFSKFNYGLFGSFGGLGLGVVGATDTLIDPMFYAGLGFPLDVAEDIPLWVGASAGLRSGGVFGREVDLSIGATALPLDRLLVGLAIKDLIGNGPGITPTLDAHWNAAEWLSVRGTLSFNDADTLAGSSAVTSLLGLDFWLFERVVALSSTFDIGREELRFGVEMLFGDDLIAGSFNELSLQTGNVGYRGGLGLLRYRPEGSDAYDPSEPYIPGETPRRGGWAPERSYTPEGLAYTYNVSDATLDPLALKRPCDVTPSGFDSPEDLYNTVESGGKPYEPLAEALRSLTTEKGDVLKEVRRTFYSQIVRSAELMSGDTLAISSNDGYSIGVQSVDNSAFPLVSVYMQVSDSEGRSVRGLGKENFSFADRSVEIVSVRPIDSTKRLPVDVTMIVDCSGSMGEEIDEVRANAQSFVDHMEASGADYRIGGVLYGSVIYDTLHPTNDFGAFRQFISNASAIGGDEITSLAIQAATEMEYRPGAQRIFVTITDDWVMQQNAKLTESDVVSMLWDTKARLYSISNPCKNNAAVATRLSLGTEYNIRAPFNSILDDIGTDITTTYELVYRSKMKEVEKVTILRGRVKDELGRPVGSHMTIQRSVQAGTGVQHIFLRSNQTTGEYEVEIAEGYGYQVELGKDPYLPLREGVDLSGVEKGDTVVRDFVLKLPQTTLSGQILNHNERGVQGKVRIDDATTLENVMVVETDLNGRYSTDIDEGRLYRLTPVVPDHLPTPVELDTRETRKGTKLVQDLRVLSIDHAIATGTTFQLKNIFFDFDKDVLKDESIPELQKLIGLLEEFPSIRVEIGAHTDAKGSDAYNEDLSDRRAASVVTYLVGNGIEAARLDSKGYGETTPIATNDTDEGRALNRRVEFKLVR